MLKKVSNDGSLRNYSFIPDRILGTHQPKGQSKLKILKLN